MKKLITLLIVLICCVGTVGATDYIVTGSSSITKNNHQGYWTDDDNKLVETSLGSGIYTLVVENCSLSQDTNYGFQIKPNENSWNDSDVFPSSQYNITVPYTGTYTIIYYVDITNKAIRVLAMPILRCGLYSNWNYTYDPSHEFSLNADGLTYTYEISSENLSGDTSFRIFSPIFKKSAYPNGQNKTLSYGGEAISSEYFNTAENTDWSWKITKPDYSFEKVVVTALYNPFANSDFGTWTVSADAYITVSVSPVGYATFSYACPLDLTSVTDFDAYVASGIDDVSGSKFVHMTKITGAVPSETGLLLVKEGGCTNVEVPVAATVEAPTNLLVATVNGGTIDASTSDHHRYFLANGTNGIGFYNLASNATSGANKAYLDTGTTELTTVTGSNTARAGWIFDDGETTTIDYLTTSQFDNNAPMYNVAGQRVAKDYRGIVIQNGKKYINK